MNQDKPNVLILSTGGTLGMRPVDGGPLQPDKVLSDLQHWLPELGNFVDVTVEIVADIDSSTAQPGLWLNLANRIEEASSDTDCDGIVVLHGTDTMAFTASALSFLLPGLSMPVVLTGSQRPLAETRTDARNNIIGAVESALKGPNEVMVFFNNVAWRGNRVTKVAISDFNGFDSPNCPPLGRAGISWQWDSRLFLPASNPWPVIPSEMPKTPMILPWAPGLDFDTLIPSLEQHWAVIIEAFGAGNMPLPPHKSSWMRSYMDKGGIVLVKSQAMSGRIDLEAYEPGRILMELGVVGCADMTREAAVAKLMTLKALGMAPEKIRRLMAQPIMGELTPVHRTKKG